MFFPVGDMGLVGWRAAHPHLCQPHHHLQDIHVADDLTQFGRGATFHQPAHCALGDVDVHQHAGNLHRWGGHRFLCHRQIECMVGNPKVNGVKVGARFAVQFNDNPSLNAQARLGIIGAIGDDQARFGPRLDKGLFVDVTIS